MKKLMLLFLLVCCPAFGADSAHTIVQKGREFHPGEVTINRGESLTFTNNDEFIHQIYVTSDNFNFDTDAPKIFAESGTFAKPAWDFMMASSSDLDKFRKRVEVSGIIHYRKNGMPISIEAEQIIALPDDSELPTAEDVRGILRS